MTKRRRAKLAASARKEGLEVGARQWESAGWTVGVTGLPPERLGAAGAWEPYRARWQVELLFERWEGKGGLAKSAGRARERVLAQLMAESGRLRPTERKRRTTRERLLDPLLAARIDA